MLILTRKVGESFMIGDEISVTNMGVKGNQVRIGIDAPKGIPVHREEIYIKLLREKMKEGNQEAKFLLERINLFQENLNAKIPQISST